jgi:hypothetical protein
MYMASDYPFGIFKHFCWSIRNKIAGACHFFLGQIMWQNKESLQKTSLQHNILTSGIWDDFSSNQKQDLPVVAIFVNWSGRNEQSL